MGAFYVIALGSKIFFPKPNDVMHSRVVAFLDRAAFNLIHKLNIFFGTTENVGQKGLDSLDQFTIYS